MLILSSYILIAVVFRLERTFDLDADVIGLILAQFGQFHADLLQMQAGNKKAPGGCFSGVWRMACVIQPVLRGRAG